VERERGGPVPSTESVPVEIEVPTLTGVWIHDVDDPAGTIRQYAYGAKDRTESISVRATVMEFDGRTYPVVDFGEQQGQRVELSVQIPFGTDAFTSAEWRDSLNSLLSFAQLRKTICYRDGRGRRLFGVMIGCKNSDDTTGTTVQISVDRVDYDEAA
jgi:hypothetical protein